MSDITSTIETLRNSRGADDIIERLKAGSLEARRERIAEALNDSNWKDSVTNEPYGPVDLIGTYTHHALVSKSGMVMRVELKEDDNVIKLGKVEIFDVPVPATDIGAEIIETARMAVDAIISENIDTATPMITSIARALDIKGNLQRQIESDVRLRSLTRDAWWQDVVSENYTGTEVTIPSARTDGGDAKSLLIGSIDDLLSIIKTEASEAARAIQKLSDRKDLHAIYTECARDISDDLKNAITALSDVDREQQSEMQTVYETVGHVAPRLIQGSKFLVQLANS